MSGTYLAVDLDAKQKAQRLAKAAGVEPGEILWGLLELWEHAWREKTAEISQGELDGCFGDNQRIRSLLVVYGFIEATDSGFRVRGAERYLRIHQARSEGGKRAKQNLRQFKVEPVDEPTPLPADHRLEPEKCTGSHPGSAPGLTANSEQRTAFKDVVRDAEQVPLFALTGTPTQNPSVGHTSSDIQEDSSPAVKKPSKPSWQQQMAGLMTAQRNEALPDAVPDKTYGVQRLNAMLKPLSDAKVDPDVLRDAHALFLRSARHQGLHPPCPLWAFAQDWPEFVDRAVKLRGVA